MGLICSGTGEATLETFTASELFGLLENFVHGWLVKEVVVVEPCERISSDRTSGISMAFLFQGASPPVLPITSFSHSANLDPKGNFQLSWARITMAME